MILGKFDNFSLVSFLDNNETFKKTSIFLNNKTKFEYNNIFNFYLDFFKINNDVSYNKSKNSNFILFNDFDESLR